MNRAGFFILILILWCFLSLTLVLGTLFAGPTLNKNLGLNLLTAGSSKNIFDGEEVYASSKGHQPNVLSVI